MNDPSWRCNPPTSLNTASATSLQESAGGVTPSDSPDGLQTDLFGRVVAPVSPSAVRENLGGGAIRAIFGQRGIASSASAALQSSLVSRLKQRLDTAGSTLFAMTWKQKATPSGRSVCLLRASGHRTSGSGCGSWPTPLVSDTDEHRNHRDPRPIGYRALAETVRLSSWPTPRLSDTTGSRILNEDGNRTNQEATMTYGANLSDKVKLASWPTPNAGPQNDGDTTWEARREALKAQHKNGNGFGLTLGQASSLSSWATPECPAPHDSEQTAGRPRERTTFQSTADQAGLILGLISSGSPAETASPGQLNPAFSRWLQGYPVSWCQAAIRVSRTLTLQRKRGSCG